MPDESEIKFTDTVSAIYKPVKQFIKKAERVSAQGFYLLFNRNVKQSQAETYITDETRTKIEPILVENDSLYFDDITWRSIDSLKIDVLYRNERDKQTKESFILFVKKNERFIRRRTADEKENLNLSNIMIEKKIPFELTQDTTNSRIFSVKAHWKGKYSYNFKTDSAAFIDIFGKCNKNKENTIKVYDKNLYGILILDMKNTGNIANPNFYSIKDSDTLITSKLEKGQLILYLYNEKEEKIDEIITRQDTSLIFDNLLPQKYSFRVLYDENNNGKWDPGNYIKNLQPERVLLYPSTIPIKETWEINIEWNISFRQKK